MFKPQLSTKLFVMVSLSFALIGSDSLKANSQSLLVNQSQSNLIAQNSKVSTRLSFNLPSRGVPGGRVGGATRGGKSVTAVLPATKLGLTASESPAIFVYIPANKSSYGELIIFDENKKEVYSSKLPSIKEEGILMVKLPETLNLSNGIAYEWRLSLIDEEGKTSSKLKTQGWVEKVAINDNLKKANQENIETWTAIEILAQEGIWQDTLEELAILHLANPENVQIQQEWSQLLMAVGLENIAGSKILPNVIEVK